MNSSNIEPRPLAQKIDFSDSKLIVTLIDRRIIHIPISWYPSLANASEKQRTNWELLGEGDGIHWPDLDEDLSVEGIDVRHPLTSDKCRKSTIVWMQA